MAANAARTVTINFTGDIIADKIFAAAENAVSPASITIHELALGPNTITVPLATGVTVKGATIIPPAGNTQALILKGIAGDTGVSIGLTDPTSISFGTAPVNFVLNAAGIVSGLRIVWT